MSTKRSPKELDKFLSYVLGRRPDEFGLVTDPDGFVKNKELLKALHEEDGWHHIRRGDLDAVVTTLPDASIEIEDDLIRAKDRNHLVQQSPAEQIPKHLYTCVTQKAYPFVQEKGVLPGGFSMVILSSNTNMAERIGKRRGHEQVMLTVNTQRAIDQGVLFYQAGEFLFTAKNIPAGCFTGPLLPKIKSETIRPSKKSDDTLKKTAGTFSIDPEHINEKQKRHAWKKRRNEVGWKEDRKKFRRGQNKSWP